MVYSGIKCNKSLIYKSLDDFLETDEKVNQDSNWGMMGDELVSSLRRIVITKNWNLGLPVGTSFLSRFLEASNFKKLKKILLG